MLPSILRLIVLFISFLYLFPVEFKGILIEVNEAVVITDSTIGSSPIEGIDGAEELYQFLFIHTTGFGDMVDIVGEPSRDFWMKLVVTEDIILEGAWIEGEAVNNPFTVIGIRCIEAFDFGGIDTSFVSVDEESTVIDGVLVAEIG
jgi:hypothetical protein